MLRHSDGTAGPRTLSGKNRDRLWGAGKAVHMPGRRRPGWFRHRHLHLRGASARARRRRLILVVIVAVLFSGAAVGAVAGQGTDRNSAASASRGKGPTPPPSAVGVTPSPAPAAPTATAPPSQIPSPANPQPAWQDMPADMAAIAADFLDEQGAAGLAVAVSTGSRGTASARYLTTAGQAAAGTAWTEDTRSAYRSITKSFVGTVVLQLVGEGRLGLDDPVARYVPDVAGVELDGTAAGDRITVREALEMRSGLAEFSGTQEFSDRLDADYTRSFSDSELLGYAFDEPLDFAPGSQYEYSNTNYVLLGEVVRAVTGTPWDQEAQARVLAPLGLTSVAYSGAQDPAGPVATPHQTGDSGLESLAQVSPSLYGASGGYFGTIADLLTWGRALGSGQLLPPGLQSQRLTAVSDPGADNPGSPYYTAYGLAAGEIDGWWGHSGTGLGYEALTLYNPATGTTVAILINTQLPNPNGPAILFDRLEGLLADLG
ncbi:hypothetical protein GCM10009849_26600 [Sinomonas flava]|uniref:Beta-lactamase-related domain-containing protein n=2 Tax=Sinomonas flava TaxID=496857 RepID=A0ABP5NPU9_9MICC